jgi:hypothetical protein
MPPKQREEPRSADQRAPDGERADVRIYSVMTCSGI